MTDQQNHPITPPLALIDQWWDEAKQNAKYDEPIGPLVATQAAQWGANQELEACVEWLGTAPVVWDNDEELHPGTYLRIARRPKPPSLKEQALAAQQRMWDGTSNHDDWNLIRRALETLPND